MPCISYGYSYRLAALGVLHTANSLSRLHQGRQTLEKQMRCLSPGIHDFACVRKLKKALAKVGEVPPLYIQAAFGNSKRHQQKWERYPHFIYKCVSTSPTILHFSLAFLVSERILCYDLGILGTYKAVYSRESYKKLMFGVLSIAKPICTFCVNKHVESKQKILK